MNILTTIVASLLAAAFPIKSGNNSFSGGEEQVYIIHYQWGVLNADVARIYCTCDSTTIQGQAGYKARIYGKTAKFCEAIVKVREDFTSWFTADGLRPVKYKRKAQEGKFNGGESYVYDWDARKLHMTVTGKSSESVREYDLEDGVLDVPSFFYIFRNMDLDKVGNTPHEVKVAVGDKIETLFITYLGKETLNARGMDKVATNKFSLSITSGQTFDPKNAVILYASDDEVMVPIYVEAPMKRGKVVGRLETSMKKK